MKSINYALAEYKLSMGIINTQHDQQFIQWFVRGLNKLRQLEQYVETMKSVRLIIDKENNSAVLPDDYNSMVQLGVCVNGQFINFDRNEMLCEPGGCPCNDSEQILNTINSCCNGENSINGAWPFWAYPVWGEPFSYSYSAGSYGIGPGFYTGGYKIDVAKRLIYFDKCVKVTHCNLVYFGDFMTDTGNALVPDDMVELLINWNEWCRKRFSPDPALRREAPQERQTWFRSLQDYNAKNQAMNKSAWLKLFERYAYLGVKA